MPERAFTPDEALLVAKAAGFDVSDLERQTQQNASETDLRSKVESLEAKLAQLSEATPPSPQEQELALAEQLRDHMNASLTRWHSPGEPDAA